MWPILRKCIIDCDHRSIILIFSALNRVCHTFSVNPSFMSGWIMSQPLDTMNCLCDCLVKQYVSGISWRSSSSLLMQGSYILRISRTWIVCISFQRSVVCIFTSRVLIVSTFSILSVCLVVLNISDPVVNSLGGDCSISLLFTFCVAISCYFFSGGGFYFCSIVNISILLVSWFGLWIYIFPQE